MTKDEATGQKVKQCASWLHMREWINYGEARLVNANFCKKHVVCPACAWRRSVKLIAKYTEKAETLQKLTSGLTPVMITIGVRNGDDLIERLDHLKASLKRLTAAQRKGKSESGRHERIEWNKVEGSVRAIEVTNTGNGWHPHAHVFALVSDFIDRRKLSLEWLRFTQDSYIVDVRECKNGIIAGMCEVLKYTTKTADLTHGQLFELFEALKASRLVDAYGILRGFADTGDIDQDPMPALDGPTREFLAKWSWGKSSFDIYPIAAESLMSKEEEAVYSCMKLKPS